MQVKSLGQPWKRKCKSTPVFLPGKFHGQSRLTGYSPGVCKELDVTKRPCTHTHTHTQCPSLSLINFLALRSALFDTNVVTVETVTDFIFLGSRITADDDCSHEIKILAPWKKSYDQLRQHIKKQRYYFAFKGPSSQSYVFSSSHVQM